MIQWEKSCYEEKEKEWRPKNGVSEEETWAGIVTKVKGKSFHGGRLTGEKTGVPMLPRNL